MPTCRGRATENKPVEFRKRKNQTELQLGIISDDDKAALIAWIGYIKAVQAVDTTTAPEITLPEQPQ